MHAKRKNPETVEQFSKDLISQLIKRREQLNISQEKLNETIGS